MSKPLGIKNYGSIQHLSSSKLGSGDHYMDPKQESLLTTKLKNKDDAVIVMEKYDGSNVGIAKVNDVIVPLNRAGYNAFSSPYKQHHLFGKWVHENYQYFYDTLEEGERISGEWMLQSSGIKYCVGFIPFMMFDFFDKDNNRKLVNSWPEDTPFHKARIIHNGLPIQPDKLVDELNKDSPFIFPLGGDKPEGMVYRYESEGKVKFLGKWVRDDFEAGKYLKEADKNGEPIWNKLITMEDYKPKYKLKNNE